MWHRRYEALARAKGLRAQASKRDPAVIRLAVPVRAGGAEVLEKLDAARALIAEADAVEQSPEISDSPESIAKLWWTRQQA